MPITTTTSTTRSRRRRHGALLALVALISTLFIAPASADGHAVPAENVIAQRGDKTIAEFPTARVYDDDSGSGYISIIGGDMIDVCTAEGPPPSQRLVVTQTARGHWNVKLQGGSVNLYTSVYKTDLGVFEFFDAVCGAFFGEGIPIPAPFAVGFIDLVIKEVVRDIADYFDPMTPQGQGRYQNGGTGIVADADGNLYEVVINATFTVGARGQFRFVDRTVELIPLEV